MSAVRDTIARLGRDVAHEVVVNVLAALAVGAMAFVLLDGRVDGLYVRARGAAPVSDQVAVVSLDEETFYLWNPYDPSPETTPRALLAETVRFLSAAGAKVIVLDLLTDQPAPGDDALVAAVQAHGRVVAAERFSPQRADGVAPFAAASVLSDVALPAYANLGLEERTLFSGGMIVRDVPLVAAVARARLSGPFPVGLVGAFAAREVFVATMGIVYRVGDSEDDTAPLSDAMTQDRRPDGSPTCTPLVALSMLVWFVLAMQCISTTAVVRRETGGWTWPLIQLVSMNLIAYAACLVIYQGGRALGF